MRRAILLTAFALATLGGRANAQEHDLTVPSDLKISPMYGDATLYFPDSTYDLWWHEVAACEGLQLPSYYVLVRWVEVNYPYFIVDEDPPPPGNVTLGHSFMRDLEVYIAAPYRRDPVIIWHEMTHFLLYWNRIAAGGHPMPYFDGHCGFGPTYNDTPRRKPDRIASGASVSASRARTSGVADR